MATNNQAFRRNVIRGLWHHHQQQQQQHHQKYHVPPPFLARGFCSFKARDSRGPVLILETPQQRQRCFYPNNNINIQQKRSFFQFSKKTNEPEQPEQPQQQEKPQEEESIKEMNVEKLLPPDLIDPITKDKLSKRVNGIIMNPNGFSHQILPGDYVIKTNPKTKDERRIPADRGLGYFWMMKDLSISKNKPILSNKEIIPAKEASLFPELHGLETLSGEATQLPHFFLKTNLSKDPEACCTLVTITYREFGNQMLSSWIDPFRKEFTQQDRININTIYIHEGTIFNWLRPIIISGMKRNIISEYHDSTLIHFQSTTTQKVLMTEFRDMLRMHNHLTAYLFLIDGIGRIRWAGSGNGEEMEVQQLIQFAKELTPPLSMSNARPRTTTKKQKKQRKNQLRKSI